MVFLFLYLLLYTLLAALNSIWLHCSCPVSPPVFFFINQKKNQQSKGRSFTRCSLLCQVDFKQVQLPEQWGLTPTQPYYCLWFCVFVVFLCVYVKERGVSGVNSECPWCLEVLHWSAAMHRTWEGLSESLDRTEATFSAHIKAGSPHWDTGLWESDMQTGGAGVGRCRWRVEASRMSAVLTISCKNVPFYHPCMCICPSASTSLEPTEPAHFLSSHDILSDSFGLIRLEKFCDQWKR